MNQTKLLNQFFFFVYKLVPTEQVSSIQQIMRSTAGKISYRLKIPAFTDDKRIYTLVRLENLEIDKAFRLSYEAEEKLDIQKNKKIYADVVRHYINEKQKLQKSY